MLKTGANVLSADPLRDLLLIAYRGQLYVQPTPDAEPLAVFDAQEVQRVLTAEGENRQTLAAALVAIRLGHAVRHFGGSRPLATAYTLLAAAEAMAAARLLLPPLGGPAGLPVPRQARLADRQLQASRREEQPC